MSVAKEFAYDRPNSFVQYVMVALNALQMIHARRYILFGIITFAVLVVPPVALWLDPWIWNWATIYFVVAVNFALAVYM